MRRGRYVGRKIEMRLQIAMRTIAITEDLRPQKRLRFG